MNNRRNISHAEARILIELFMAGETTLADEQDLYAYYTGSDIAPDLTGYRDMMRWYAAVRKPTATSRIAPRVIKLWRKCGIAAMLAVIVATGISYLSYRHERDLLLASYEGSYVIRDGKKITDLNEILPELQHTEAYVAQWSEIADAETMINELYNDIINQQTEPAIREALREDLLD